MIEDDQAGGRAARTRVGVAALARHPSRLLRGGRPQAAGLARGRAHARAARSGAPVVAHARAAVRRRARRADGQPGGAAGEGRPEGDLPQRLAGRRRREPRRDDLSRPVAVPGELRADGRAPDQQRASACRPDPLGGGQARPRLVRADRRRRRGGVRRAAERLRVDARDGRSRRRRRALRGPALVGEEVRPPRRQGGRADRAVHPHADGRAPRGRRLRRAVAC